jgi:NifB/MoaA-like Fe-S oxidoreductase
VLLVPDVMLKEGEGVFLDDLTPADLERELAVRVKVVETSPEGLYAGLKEAFRGKRR